MNRNEMLRLLTEYDFIATDMQLYLDTHPTDTAAIAKYNEAIEAGDKLRASYEEAYGPLYSFRSSSDSDSFSWIDEPWVWQKDFNFAVKEAGR
jgi:spore coat protein JB